MAEAFLSASLQLLFDRMASTEFIDFVKTKKLNYELLKELEITLFYVKAVLDDAEEKQIRNNDIKKWLDELRDAVYDAEDILDEISTEALRSQLKAESQVGVSKVRNLISSFNPFNKAVEETNAEIKQVLEKLKCMDKQRSVLGLKEGVAETPSRNFESTSLVDESDVLGREADKESLIEVLQSDAVSGNGIDVVAIVALGGAGKTTLAQLVYNDDRVKKWFDLKAWVCVSAEFDVFRVTKTIFEEVSNSTCGINNLNMLQVKLKESLTGKKYLFVLDDVWNENYGAWEMLHSPFNAGARGSKILVTTRNENVARIVRTVPTRCLKLLSDEDCWRLFSRHALVYGQSGAVGELESIGKQIVKRCKGLPLAAKTLGGLLRFKSAPEEWDRILKSDIWELSEEESQIIPALRISYLHLPSHLKRCFAYCSIFPKDYEFEKEELIQLWMAENLLHRRDKKKRLDEVGDEYFRDLVSRSFFQPLDVKYPEWGYIMHDLVHDLAKSVSGEFCFHIEGCNSDGVPQKTRHLAFLQAEHDDFEKFEGISVAKSLRTFLPLQLYRRGLWATFSNEDLYHLLPSLSHLRVLSLDNYRNLTELPDSIGNLKFLRLLNLSGTSIRGLPESITTLLNLQTLLLNWCSDLTQLPADLSNLINLCYLDLRGTKIKEMPANMGRLKCLQKLSSFPVGKQGGTDIRELGHLNDLCGALSISELQNVIGPSVASEARLKDKQRLEELEFKWNTDCSDSQVEREVLKNLQPHTNLKTLAIKNYGGTMFPHWLGDESFSNIVSLRLENCEYCILLPPLGQLPSLRELRVKGIHEVVTVGLEFYGSGSSTSKPFASLEHLWFVDMLEWKEWQDNEAWGFPNLKTLEMRNCPKLTKELPQNLPSLIELNIKGCEQLEASLQPHTNLKTLAIENYGGTMFPDWLGDESFSNIVSLRLEDCKYCVSLPPLGQLPFLRELHVEGFHGVVTVGLEFYGSGSSTSKPFASLERLWFVDMLEWKEWQDNEAWGFPNLKTLETRNCPKLTKELPQNLPSLIKLNISGCQQLEASLPYAFLESLSIGSGCDSLKSVPLDLLPSLKTLRIRGCMSLESILAAGGTQHYLESLHIEKCPKFAVFTEDGLSAPNLTSIDIDDCKSLKSLPVRMYTLLPSLKYLYLLNCPELLLFPEGGLPPNLEALEIYDCEKLVANRGEWDLQRHNSIRDFTISGNYEDVHSFPEEGLLPTSITHLSFYGSEHLKSLNGKELHKLTGLKALRIHGCPSIQCLPEEGLPSTLSRLEIYGCPLLKTRCEQEKGEDWSKISRIPDIFIG